MFGLLCRKAHDAARRAFSTKTRTLRDHDAPTAEESALQKVERNKEPVDHSAEDVRPSRITKGVSDEIKIAMASAIMAFSDMEMSAEQFIWDVLGLSIDDGKLVTQIDTIDKIELAKKLGERIRSTQSGP
jgi:hypothetical protein